MLSPGNLPPQPENQSANPKTEPQKPLQEQPLKCPRCDSSNTKFCYYNNYSLTQPRHFCKTCRRYWTRGGALRNVPIGGGCRKPNKRVKTTTPTPANTTSKLFSGPTGFNFMNPVGLGQGQGQGQTPAIGFDPAGVYTQFITSTMPMPMPTLSKSGPGPGTGPYFGLNLMDLNYSLSLPSPHGNTGGNEHQNSISSIESLSSINQEMHWKLQQQRLAMFYGTASSKTDDDNKGDDDQEKPQGARKVEVGPTEWLFNNQIETSVNNMGISRSNSTDCNNVNEVVGGTSNLSGVWGDLLDHHHHHHHQHQQLQFNGLD